MAEHIKLNVGTNIIRHSSANSIVLLPTDKEGINN